MGELELPAGTDVLVSPYLVHRHPRYWRDADRFDPDRFLPDALASRNRFELEAHVNPRTKRPLHMNVEMR